MCLTDAAQCVRPLCASVKLTSLAITQNGGPHPQADGGPDAVQFGTAPEQWVSYTYQGPGQQAPTVTMLPDGNGFHVTASVVAIGGVPSLYAGAGLSFLGNDCVDGSDLTGVEFQLDGDLAQHSLAVGVVSIDDVSTMYDPRGTCTGGMSKCYGPTAPVAPSVDPIQATFGSLVTGMPTDGLEPRHIVNVQWQLGSPTNTVADFTISNVQFY